MYTPMQHMPSKIQRILVPFIKNSYLRIIVNEFYCIFKMEVEQPLILAVLPELMDAEDDKKPTHGKTRVQIKRRSLGGYFKNVICELIIKDKIGPKKGFWISVKDFGFVLKHIDGIICPKEMNAGNRPILSDERLTFSVRSLGTGESFQSLSFQF